MGNASFEAFELLNLYYESNHPNDLIKVHIQIHKIHSEIMEPAFLTSTQVWYYQSMDHTLSSKGINKQKNM